MSSPHVLSWVNPTTYSDGVTPYPQADNAGYTIELDGAGAVSVPLAWGTTFDLSTLAAFQALSHGSHTVALAAVSVTGGQGAFSAPDTFSVVLAPMAPTSLKLL